MPDNWFPKWTSLPSDFRRKAENVSDLRGQFLAAVSKNILGSLRSSLPILNLSFIFRLLLGENKVRKIPIIHEDFQEVLYGYVKNVLVKDIPNTVRLTREWDGHLREIIRGKVFELKGWFSCIHVVAAFFSPLRLQDSGRPEWCRAHQGYLDALFAAYSAWQMARRNAPAPRSVFFTVGIPDGWNEAIRTPGAKWVTLSSFRNEVNEQTDWQWKPCHPPRCKYRLAIRDFTDLMEPVTLWEEKFSKVKRWIDNSLRIPANLVTLEKVWEAFEGRVRRSRLREMFLELDTEGDYTVYDSGFGPTIKKATEREMKKETYLPPDVRKFVRRHGYGLIATAIGYIAAELTAQFFGRKLGAIGVVVVIMAGYFTDRLASLLSERPRED